MKTVFTLVMAAMIYVAPNVSGAQTDTMYLKWQIDSVCIDAEYEGLQRKIDQVKLYDKDPKRFAKYSIELFGKNDGRPTAQEYKAYAERLRRYVKAGITKMDFYWMVYNDNVNRASKIATIAKK